MRSINITRMRSIDIDVLYHTGSFINNTKYISIKCKNYVTGIDDKQNKSFGSLTAIMKFHQNTEKICGVFRKSTCLIFIHQCSKCWDNLYCMHNLYCVMYANIIL